MSLMLVTTLSLCRVQVGEGKEDNSAFKDSFLFLAVQAFVIFLNRQLH